MKVNAGRLLWSLLPASCFATTLPVPSAPSPVRQVVEEWLPLYESAVLPGDRMKAALELRTIEGYEAVVRELPAEQKKIVASAAKLYREVRARAERAERSLSRQDAEFVADDDEPSGGRKRAGVFVFAKRGRELSREKRQELARRYAELFRNRDSDEGDMLAELYDDFAERT